MAPRAPQAQDTRAEAEANRTQGPQESGLAGAFGPSEGPTRGGSAAQQHGLAVETPLRDPYATRFEQQLGADALREELSWQPRYAARVGTRGTYRGADDEDLRVPPTWFVLVVGVGHGCRPGLKAIDGIPDVVRARMGEVAKRRER